MKSILNRLNENIGTTCRRRIGLRKSASAIISNAFLENNDVTSLLYQGGLVEQNLKNMLVEYCNRYHLNNTDIQHSCRSVITIVKYICNTITESFIYNQNIYSELSGSILYEKVMEEIDNVD